jgi:hypothetical protein
MSNEDKKSPGSRTILQYCLVTAIFGIIMMVAIMFMGKEKLVLNILMESPHLIALVILAICIIIYLSWRLFRGGVTKEPLTGIFGGIVREVFDSSGISKYKETDGKDVDLDFDERLRKLHELYKDGILSEEEYQKEKRKVLDRDE